MPQKVRIALDAMGGDVGASVVVPGAAMSLARHPNSEFLLFGKRELIEPELAKHPALKAVSRVIHTDVAVSMEDKQSQALRRRWPVAVAAGVLITGSVLIRRRRCGRCRPAPRPRG